MPPAAKPFSYLKAVPKYRCALVNKTHQRLSSVKATAAYYGRVAGRPRYVGCTNCSRVLRVCRAFFGGNAIGVRANYSANSGGGTERKKRVREGFTS